MYQTLVSDFWSPPVKPKEKEKKKRINKFHLTKVCFFWRNFIYVGLPWSTVTVNIWIYAWLIYFKNIPPSNMFKPLRMFLASEFIKNLHTATFAFLLKKSSCLMHESVREPFSICKHILSIFWGLKRLFSKHIEDEQEIHHAYKKRVYYFHVRVNVQNGIIEF